jgi:hypothetical protein
MTQDLFHRLFNTKRTKFGKRSVHILDVKDQRMIIKILIMLGGFRNLKEVSFESQKDIKKFCCKHCKKIPKDTSTFFLCRDKKEELLFIQVGKNNKGRVVFKKYPLVLDVWNSIAVVFPQQSN